jgi:F-type H+-transporting ATPase subunit a
MNYNKRPIIIQNREISGRRWISEEVQREVNTIKHEQSIDMAYRMDPRFDVITDENYTQERSIEVAKEMINEYEDRKETPKDLDEATKREVIELNKEWYDQIREELEHQLNGASVEDFTTVAEAVLSDVVYEAEQKCENCTCGDKHNDIVNNEGVDSPLDQFLIRDLLTINFPILANIGISLNNLGLYVLISKLIILPFIILPNEGRIIISGWYLWSVATYHTVLSIVKSQINEKKGQMFFPFMFVLFMFILTNNLIGLVPYSFAPTSHFILTFSISFTVVLGATILGFDRHHLVFFSLLVPANCPLPLLPLLVVIEFISYLARNVSLGLRLAANILSGHMLLNILSGFTYKIMNSGYLFFVLGLAPLIFIFAFSGLEMGIAFIQAQVFIVLACSYIKDGLDLH